MALLLAEDGRAPGWHEGPPSRAERPQVANHPAFFLH
jgi:hypothetical protein